jgi:hypothetical protein
MTDENQTDELADYYDNSRKPLFRIPRHPIGRLGCAVALLIWFALLLLPCGMIYLAMGNTIAIPNDSIPEPEQHPLYEVQLIMEVENRGLKLSSSSIASEAETRLCIETTANYLLWQSDETATNSQFCQCYQRRDTASSWRYIEQYAGHCEN